MAKTTFESEVITKTIVRPDVRDALTGMTIGTLQEDYALCEADFLRLKGSHSSMITWAVNFLFVTIGYGINIVPKWIAELVRQTPLVSKEEWLTLFSGFAISALIYGIGYVCPTERKRTMEKIENHFKTAPRSRRIIREKK